MDEQMEAFLRENILDKKLKDKLAVADAKLGSSIKEALGISCVNDEIVRELMRGVREQMSSLVTGLPDSEVHAMQLGLSHSLSRYKLKFSPDKVDTMIVQAISLLDDLDKELNTYSMRLREWFGWGFPEMGKIVTDNLAYAKCVLLMGSRANIEAVDLTTVLEEEVLTELVEAARMSMGTEVSDEDVCNVKMLAQQCIDIAQYREQLHDYLKNRMQAIAPNVTTLVGNIVGARLISHAGSLLSLAKHPASTVQILGAEKALFRALKTKHDTPKYGLIYHATLVGQAPQKHKGKISRVLAAKTSLCARVDALGEKSAEENIGSESRAAVEMRVQELEGKQVRRAKKGGAAVAPTTYSNTSATYNAAADSTLDSAKDKKKKKKDKKEKESKKRKASDDEDDEDDEAAAKAAKKKHKKSKKD